MKLFPLQKPKERKSSARRKITKEDSLIAGRIKQLRKERGLTQEELSDILGMNTLTLPKLKQSSKD